MKFAAGCFALLLASTVVLVPMAAAAKVEVELKNGRTIIADFCEDAGSVLSCSKMGGSFEIEKRDIARTRELSDEGGYEGGGETPAAREGTKPGVRTEEAGGRQKAPSEGGSVRIEEIRKRKSELAPEREKLMKEREKLQKDLKNAPDWMTTKQYEEMKKRNAEIDEKIKKYNEEVGGLNREEKHLTAPREKQKKD